MIPEIKILRPAAKQVDSHVQRLVETTLRNGGVGNPFVLQYVKGEGYRLTVKNWVTSPLSNVVRQAVLSAVRPVVGSEGFVINFR